MQQQDTTADGRGPSVAAQITNSSDGLDLAAVQRISLGPGDIVVVRCDRVMTMTKHEYIKAQMQSVLRAAGHDNQIIIMDGTLSIAVIGGQVSATS